MKTAVSIPDRLFREAEKTASELGIPRSQLIARALEEFIEHHKRQGITERLNRVYSNDSNRPSKQELAAGLDALRSLTEDDTW